ncbi:MAG TPA: hypothetical protein VM142_02390 [Acidimicrobiales bacterium]|nr:hypothetical protein [Acidimicrobiales bacterium]
MFDMRRCGRCGETLSVEQFAWRRQAKNQRDNYCRPCRSDYKREHYQTNKARYIEAAARRGNRVAGERTRWLIEFFRSHPCVDCGEADPVVLEFDHLRDKSFTIARSFRYLKWSTIQNEIAKCDVVCANCHRRRTAARGGFLRAAVAQR